MDDRTRSARVRMLSMVTMAGLCPESSFGQKKGAFDAFLGEYTAMGSRALKFQGIMIGSMSGSVGGATYARARGGVTYIRERVTPTNPNTQLQAAIRSAVSSASALWRTGMTDEQRQAWFDIAEGTQSGKSLFNRVNNARIFAKNAGRSRTVDDNPAELAAFLAPPTSLSTEFSSPVPEISAGSDSLSLANIPAGAWNTGASNGKPAAIFIYVTPGQLSSRGARQFSYKLARAVVVGQANAIESITVDLAAIDIPTVQNRVSYVRIYAQSPTGGVSVSQEFRVTVGV